MPGNTDPDRPSNQDYATPPALVALFAEIPGVEFSIDLAGTWANRKAPLVLSREDGIDALEVDWKEVIEPDSAGWLNPPYDFVKPWAKKVCGVGSTDRFPRSCRHVYEMVSRLCVAVRRGLPVISANCVRRNATRN